MGANDFRTCEENHSHVTETKNARRNTLRTIKNHPRGISHGGDSDGLLLLFPIDHCANA